MTESDVVLANHCENSNVDCENSNVDMDALRREISTLQKLLKQLQGKCEINVDTRSIGTQTDEIVSNTQTADLEFAPLNLTIQSQTGEKKPATEENAENVELSPAADLSDISSESMESDPGNVTLSGNEIRERTEYYC